MKNYDLIKKAMEKALKRGAWNQGVHVYAVELLDNLKEGINGGWYCEEDITNPRLLEEMMLNGATNWGDYSWGGCSLIYNCDIAKRLCNRSELKITRNGESKPSPREEWLDVQARALYQACDSIKKAVKAVNA